MRKIFLLGQTGMLGSMILKTWPDIQPINRDAFDAASPSYGWWREGDVIINCIGVIKPYCNNIERAVRVNALFPHSLPNNSIQIATDCVYSGKKGNYTESDLHDATDVYGKTKSLGETTYLRNLRCSIIGPEVKNHISLLDWFLTQQEANGFTNHLWNGLTTYHFSKIVQGAIRENIPLPNIQHLVPADKVSKAELLKIIAKEFKRDIKVKEVEAPETIDRTLSTNNPQLNLKLWKAAGYAQPPTIEQIVKELAEYA